MVVGFVKGDVAGADVQNSALGHGITGIDDQVHQHLLDLARIGFQRPETGVEAGHRGGTSAGGVDERHLAVRRIAGIQ